MEEIKQSEQEPQPVKPTNAGLIAMDDIPKTDNLSDETFVHVDCQKCQKAFFARFPYLEKIFVVMDISNSKSQCARIYETIEEQRFHLHLAHGVFLLLFGGSWVWLATLISFCVVYDVFEVLGGLNFERAAIEMKITLKTLKQIWLLMLVYYAVYTSSLLSNITVAFMLEKYISDTIHNPSIMALIEKRLPLEKTLGRWCHHVIQVVVRFVLVILSVVSYRLQVCLVMACIGCHKVYSSLPAGVQKKIDTFEGPFKLDGKPVILWGCAILCTVWQLLNGYQSSFLGMMVPFGFLIKEKVKCI